MGISHMGNDTIEMGYTPLGEQPQTATVQEKKPKKTNKMNTLFFLPEVQSSCGCINGLLSFSNQLYRFGYLFTFTILVLISLVIAPVIGFISAVLDWICMIVRAIVRPVGRVVADAVGLGSIIALKSEQIQRDLDV